jgi:hypothetical protein
MLLTEKQAWVTWCPRLTDRAKDGCRAEDFTCIGSKCMAWRWKTDPEVRGAVASTTPMYGSTGEAWSCKYCEGSGKVPVPAEGGAEVDTCEECEGQGRGTMQAPLGYCGLAGPLELLR